MSELCRSVLSDACSSLWLGHFVLVVVLLFASSLSKSHFDRTKMSEMQICFV